MMIRYIIRKYCKGINKIIILIFCTITTLIFVQAISKMIDFGETEAEILLERHSPNHKYISTYYRVFGGGAVGWQKFRIDIRETNESFSSANFVFEMSHTYDLDFRWISPTLLVIFYSADAVITRKHEKYDKILIQYENFNPSDKFIDNGQGKGWKGRLESEK